MKSNSICTKFNYPFQFVSSFSSSLKGFYYLFPARVKMILNQIAEERGNGRRRTDVRVATTPPIPGDNAFFRELVYKKVQIRWKFKEEERNVELHSRRWSVVSSFLKYSSFSSCIYPTPFSKVVSAPRVLFLTSCPSIGGNASTREKGKMDARKNTSGLFHCALPISRTLHFETKDTREYIIFLEFSDNDREEKSLKKIC